MAETRAPLKICLFRIKEQLKLAVLKERGNALSLSIFL